MKEHVTYTATSCSLSCFIPLVLLTACRCQSPFAWHTATLLLIVLLTTKNPKKKKKKKNRKLSYDKTI